MNSLYKPIGGHVIRLGVVFFWTLFWFLNVVDKFIGDSAYLWVGRDRFAQFVKFFSSVGIENSAFALWALIAGTILEIIAFVLLAMALWYLIRDRGKAAREYFFWGTFVGLALFSFFAMGDQIFGDRFELLEHTLFWIAIIISWGAYTFFSKEEEAITTKPFWTDISRQIGVYGVIAVLVVASVFVLSSFSVHEQEKRTALVEPVHIGSGVYKFDLPFLSERSVWEKSLVTFLTTHPTLRVNDIYTAPNELKSKADNVIIYVITEQR